MEVEGSRSDDKLSQTSSSKEPLNYNKQSGLYIKILAFTFLMGIYAIQMLYLEEILWALLTLCNNICFKNSLVSN